MRLGYRLILIWIAYIAIIGRTVTSEEEVEPNNRQRQELSHLNENTATNNSNQPAQTQKYPREQNLLPVNTESLRLRRRSRNGEETPPHIWALDLFEYSDFCYYDTQVVQLWRSDIKRAGELRIKNRMLNQTIELRWPANKDIIDWPLNRIDLIEGAYLIQIEDILPQKVIHFHQLPPLSGSEQITWMQQQGCY
ncbi:MAG: hypothetical protein SVR94_18105, partial [Pseudomonadota bacterium]|nr:hypothetical protein [Pseudomonadota bacterium]